MALPVLDLQEFLTDPFGSLDRVRSQGWLADFGFISGVVTHQDVRQLLTDDRLQANFADFLTNFGVTSGAFFEWMSRSPLNYDGAEHSRWRALMSRTFTPRRVEQVRPFLTTAAHELIDGFARAGSCDFMAVFADAYPSLGLCELIGVPKEDRDRFRGWANAIGYGFNPIELPSHIAEVDDALTQLIAYTSELAERRRADPRDDLVTRIAQASFEEGYTVGDTAASIAGLVFAGHETTKNQLGWTIAILADHPRVWDAVADGSLAVADVVEEVLRLRSTVTGVGRKATRPIDHKGERIEPGTQLLLSIWGADHDPAAYPKPEALDVEGHKDVPHLAFGYGAHHCIGHALARAELQEALAALAKRITCPTVEAGALWKPGVGITGPLALPITFGAR